MNDLENVEQAEVEENITETVFFEEEAQPVPPKDKKRTTKAQHWWRFHTMQAGLFAAIGAVGAVLLLLLISLAGIPAKGLLEGKSVEVAPSPSLQESLQESIAELEVSPSPSPEVSTVSIMAVGDNLIHSTIYEFAQQRDGSYDFSEIYSKIRSDIEQADLACIQQETIFVSDPSLYSNYPCFGTPAEMADSLTAVGFNVVCHASNHTYDKGETGLADTIAAWKKHPEVSVLGIHETQEDADSITVVEKNGIKIALLDYTYGLNGFVAANDWSIDLLDETHRERIAEQVDTANEISDITIVFMHDGVENQYCPSEDQKEWAQFFADHNVGLIIGTHPHVVEPVDIITGSGGNKMPIFYSLGNFVSSQRDTMNMVGGMAKAVITKDETGTYVSEYNIYPLVTLIQMGGTVGSCYRFHTYHMEDYIEELAAAHIRSNCGVEDMQAVWDEIFKEASIGTDDSRYPLSAGTPRANFQAIGEASAGEASMAEDSQAA